MTMTDPIADMLTRIRNGQQAKKETVLVPASGLKKSVLNVLKTEGYIRSFSEATDAAGHPALNVELKYQGDQGVISEISRVSRPGLRKYFSSHDLPRVRNGLGVAIVSTSKGVMGDADAREQNVGGEVLCTVF